MTRKLKHFLHSEFEKISRAPTKKPTGFSKSNFYLSEFIGKMDDPIARKLEGILYSLNMQLRLEEASNLKIFI